MIIEKINKMVKFCLKLGSLDKKLVMLIIYTILYFIMQVIEYYSNMSELHLFLDDFYSRGISYILIIILPFIQKSRNKNSKFKENRKNCKQITIDLFYIYLTYLFYFINAIYIISLKAKDPKNTGDYKMSHYKGFCSEEALEIIFIVIISKFLLKMSIYKHHYIGLIIFLLLSLFIDLLFELSIFKPNIFFIFIYILFKIFDSIYITYEKYMMDKLGYSPYTVVFSIGFIYLFSGTLGVIILSFTGSVFYDGNKYLLESFEDYFYKNNYKQIILHIIYLISFRFFINILKILTVYYFSPIHTFASYIIIKMLYLLLRKDPKYKYYSLILFVFQFLGLLIFLEIIELNFCNLDKNTKRNVEKRETKEIEGLFEFQEIADDETASLEENNAEGEIKNISCESSIIY